MKNTRRLVILVIVCVLILVGAAFVAGRFISGNAGALGVIFNPGAQVSQGNVETTISEIPAPELPTTRPLEQAGLLVELSDNTLTIQTWALSGESIEFNGPKLEVVVGHDTIIYQDVTNFNEIPENNTTYQQVVEQKSIEDIPLQSLIVIWGTLNGDRVEADVILFTVLSSVP